MADAFVGEVRLFPYGFVPANWLECDGAKLEIQRYTPLFAVIGTTYGGNGSTNFAVPDLRGAVPMGQGSGPGLPPAPLGLSTGAETVTLSISQLPQHTHTLKTITGPYRNDGSFTGAPAAGASWVDRYFDLSSGQPQVVQAYDPSAVPTNRVQMAPQAISPYGNGQPHENRQPFVVVRYCICFAGTFPPHS